VKTNEDLQAAFAGESQANRKYTAWAEQAEREGYEGVAKLFRAVAAAETVHALNHFRTMGMVNSTEENLKAAIGGEHYEVETMYPDFLADARADEHRGAMQSFGWAWAVEKVHEQLYTQALKDLESGEDGLVGKKIWVCDNCGHTHIGDEHPEKCPVCSVPGKRFMLIE
jgi:rubrerythrin